MMSNNGKLCRENNTKVDAVKTLPIVVMEFILNEILSTIEGREGR